MQIAGDRYVGESYDSGRIDNGPRVWHIDPGCSAMAGKSVVKLTPEHQAEIEITHNRLLRPCRLCSK